MSKSLFDFGDEVIVQKINNWTIFKEYYKLMMYSGDCDPAYPCLNYICDRLELTESQRYWISFLYGVTYSAPTTLYIYNEFPDMENVDLGRMNKWWDKNKPRLFFQTDRAKVKNFNFFVKCYESYHSLIGNDQEKTFSQFLSEPNLEKRYQNVYKFTSNLYYFGRFSLFNYIESLNEITELKTLPDVLNLRQADSSRNGLCYATNSPQFITLHHAQPKEPIQFDLLQQKLITLKSELTIENPEINVNYWNIETVLCAFKKLFWNDRYFGYYIDRQQQEISLMEKNIPEGVDWSILWDFRKEYFDNALLGELNNWSGIRKERMELFNKTKTFLYPNEKLEVRQYLRKKNFEVIGKIYV